VQAAFDGAGTRRYRAPVTPERLALRAALALLGAVLSGCDGVDRASPATPAAAPVAKAGAAAASSAAFVGAARCSGCHPAEAAAWRGSQHDRAMEEPSEASVLGDFADARFEHRGVVSRFFRRGGGYAVETEGPGGKPAAFEIAYTFGVAPLQQYLVRLPQGRLQALGTAWDARPREAGGQRWFSLHPDEAVPAGDVLHWTMPSQRWNAQCADCHSTDLRRGYDLATDTYETRFAELDVACEACHGPGARHVAWAEAAGRGEPGRSGSAGPGLAVSFPPARPADWVLESGAAIARRAAPRAEHLELETCAPCHARRALLREGRVPGEPLLDTHRPALLEEGLYEADGQMRDEVYVYGSFVQSRMHAAGVTCSDCHDPHSARLRAEGNALCGQCHRAEVFDAPAHHRHEARSSGTECVACHMPARTYMEIDARHDHSFRVPRPDLSLAIGTPNACTDCHRGRPAAWAAEAVAKWFPKGRRGTPHYGEALAAGRRGAPGADRALAALAADTAQPGVARATALSLLAAPPAEAVQRGAGDADPLVRLGALEAAQRVEPAARLAAVQPLLRDPTLAVRIEAARVLADVPPPLWRLEDRVALADALGEYRAAQLVQADRPEAHVNLGLLHVSLGEPDAARREYETALRLAPWFVPAAVNLADLERALGRDDAAEQRLRAALVAAPEVAELHHALGLTLVRLGRHAEALAALERAATLVPDEGRYAYVLGVALFERGQPERAFAVLRAARERHPGDRAILHALATLSAEAGRTADAGRFARELAAAFPGDPDARALLESLEGAGVR